MVAEKFAHAEAVLALLARIAGAEHFFGVGEEELFRALRDFPW